jgi:hypothetical protein
MRVLKSLVLTGALLGAAAVFAPSGASAMPFAAPLATATAEAGAPVVNVQYYGHRHGGYRHGGYRYGGHRRNNVGGAIAAGAAIGIIGGIIASQAQPRYYEPAPVYRAPVYGAPVGDDAYCFSKYKSYDPQSGTYLGYDGYRHPCQ